MSDKMSCIVQTVFAHTVKIRGKKCDKSAKFKLKCLDKNDLHNLWSKTQTLYSGKMLKHFNSKI